MISKEPKNLSPMTRSWWQRGLNHLTCWGSFLIATATISAAIAAEKISFFYGPVSRALRIDSLEEFATDGTVNANLQDFFNIIKPDEEAKAKFQKTLVTLLEVDPLLISRLLNTDEGDRLLRGLGTVIELEGGINGKPALRGSMVKSALSPEGLSLINFFRNLPTNMQIDISDSLRQAKQGDFLVKATENLIEATETLAVEETKDNSPIDFNQLPNPGKPGSVPFTRERWNLVDISRERSFYVDVFRPQVQKSEKIPVVILSHGLMDRPESFHPAGELLASHGFLVVMPQHPGSDTQQKEALIQGTSLQLSRLNEFIDRPLDISYTLDELERRNQREFAGQLELTKVLAIGHSYGGYTALAVAGATIDWENLNKDCSSEAGGFNQALLLQCRALKLEQSLPNFKDERISAVFVANPVNASIFSSQGLAAVKVPVFVMAGSYDLATPFVFEQARSFPWLVNAPESYLLLQDGQVHGRVSRLDGGSFFVMNSILELSLPKDNVRAYYNIPFAVAFAQVYIGGNEDYRPYLLPAYAEYLSEGQEFKAFLITGKSASGLQERFEKEAEGFRKI